MNKFVLCPQMLLELLVVALATAIFYIWRYLNNINKHWEERGIPYKKPVLFFGNSWPVFAQKQSQMQVHESVYKLFPDAKYYGFFDFMKPYLMVKDVELIERVVIKDFAHFTDHGFGSVDENTNPVDVSLFNMNGKKWKAMRNKFSPMFTTGKLKHMVPQMREISEMLVNALERKQSEDVELRDMFQRFSMDVIASCAFGLTVNALQEEDDVQSEFRKMGQLAFKFSTLQMLRFCLHICFPKAAKALKVPQNNPAVAKYFTKIIRETLAHRRDSTLTRNDFVQLMVTLQKKGSIEFEGDENDDYLKMDSEEKVEKHMETLEMTDNVMVGQAFIFLVAGFEAAANSLMWLFYEFAMSPETQVKARDEITRVMKARGGELDYDALKEMTYFGQCIQENMRLHTFVPALFRVCTKQYTFPETSLTLKPGDGLLVPVSAMHKDPKLYPDPEKFKPERFAPDVIRPNCSYLPFGDGPRICIAMRFALTEIKLCAARILLEYDVQMSPKTKFPIEMDPTNFTSLPKYPIYFKIAKINKEQQVM